MRFCLTTRAGSWRSFRRKHHRRVALGGVCKIVSQARPTLLTILTFYAVNLRSPALPRQPSRRTARDMLEMLAVR